MSSHRVTPQEVADLKARCPSWLPGYLNWSARYAVNGPRWLPRLLRWLPLNLGCFVLMVYAKGWL